MTHPSSSCCHLVTACTQVAMRKSTCVAGIQHACTEIMRKGRTAGAQCWCSGLRRKKAQAARGPGGGCSAGDRLLGRWTAPALCGAQAPAAPKGRCWPVSSRHYHGVHKRLDTAWYTLRAADLDCCTADELKLTKQALVSAQHSLKACAQERDDIKGCLNELRSAAARAACRWSSCAHMVSRQLCIVTS